MNTIYVGESRDVLRRIRSDHCRNNVEASALRKHIAERKGYELRRERRPSGSLRIRLNLPDPRMGEQEITNYLQSGFWKYVLCESYEEARDFQWYVMDRLMPLLNKNIENWNRQQDEHYAKLFDKLIISHAYLCSQLKNKKTGPGVYVLYHTEQL